MTPKFAELILALADELKKAQMLADRIAADEAAFDAGQSEILQLAAERILERIFQASTALPERAQIEYFGEEPLRFLRGIRNRLAHTYLGVDTVIVRTTIQEDLPRILANMQNDLASARRLASSSQTELGDHEHWAQQHLSELP